MSEKAYVCDRCDERFSESHLISETDPDLYEHALRDLCVQFRLKRGDPTPSAQLYHRCHAYHLSGGTSYFYLCGPVHLETEQEYFVHWIRR